jgi:hypothetical protein
MVMQIGVGALRYLLKRLRSRNMSDMIYQKSEITVVGAGGAQTQFICKLPMDKALHEINKSAYESTVLSLPAHSKQTPLLAHIVLNWSNILFMIVGEHSEADLTIAKPHIIKPGAH